jgi:two-component system cell cycle sensor histidine kinase/response regulator CckA
MPTDPPAPPLSIEAAWLEIARLDTDLATVFRRTCEIAADTLSVDRVGIWLLVEHATALRCANLFERTRREHSEGATIRVNDFPDYFAALRVMRAVPVEVADADPRTSKLYNAYLKPLGIESLLDAPLLLNGGMVGVVCHEHRGGPRLWTTEEKNFAGTVADLIALKMKAAETTDLRAALRTQEVKLAAQQQTEATARLAVGVAHDFRNLLTVIVGGAAVIADRPDVPADVAEIARQIVSAAGKGSNLVRELLDFGKADAATPKVIDPVATAGRFLPVLSAVVGRNHSLAYDKPKSVGRVLFDPTHLDRILLNLVTNAKDAMPDGGPITVRIAGEVTAENVRDTVKPYVLLEVADAGGGIDMATRARLFEPFFTTKPKASGLGLATVKRMAEAAGGFVRVESAVGTGTAVRVYLPRVAGETAA